MDDWRLVTEPAIEHYELDSLPVRLLFFTRRGGTSVTPFRGLNLSYGIGDNPDRVRENWNRVQSALPAVSFFAMKQVHSDIVVTAESGAGEPEADACFTADPGLALAVRVADCLPVYVCAVDGSCIGIAHAGWRGTAARIAEKLCRSISLDRRVPLYQLAFALGPCICPRCYVVGDDVRRRLAPLPGSQQFFSPATHGRWHLDLREANRRLLLGLGLSELPSLDICTYEDAAGCYSARRDHVTGRNLAAILIAD